MPGELITELSGRPPPHDRSVSRGLLAFVLFTAPAAWYLQTLINYALVSNGCTLAGGGVTEHWGVLWWTALGINVVALVATLSAVLLSAWLWRRARGEADRHAYGLIEVGEGRSRFLASWGIVGGILFFVFGVAFATLNLFLVPVCAG